MRRTFKTLLLLLFLHLFLEPRHCEDLLRDHNSVLLGDSFQNFWNVLECKKSSYEKYFTLERLGWLCCSVGTYNYQCHSPNGSFVLVLTEDPMDLNCLYLGKVQVKDLQLGFHKPQRIKCMRVMWSNPSISNWQTHDMHPVASQRFLRLDPELHQVLLAAERGDSRSEQTERLWDAVKAMYSYILQRVEIRGSAGAAFADPPDIPTTPNPANATVQRREWRGALDAVEELLISDAHLGDTLRLPSLPGLRVLRVEWCQLRNITSVENLAHLTELHIPGNRLRTLPPTVLNPRLILLNASYNPDLQVSASDFFALPSLYILDLSGVPSVRKLLAREPFPALRVVRLSLDECGIESFAAGEAPFARLPHLFQLSLRNNSLAEWPRSAIGPDRRVQKIQRLDLSHNSLTHIPPGALQAVEILASDNAISQWTAGTFSPHIVSILDLRRNRVTTIRGDMLEALDRLWALRRLLLEGNPLSCDPCEMGYFAKWLSSQFKLKRRDVMNLTCVHGEVRRVLLESDMECVGVAWILEFLIPLFAFVLFGAVLFAIWMRWHKQLEYWSYVSGIRPFFLFWPENRWRLR